jgi:hypothetical protein
LYSTNPKPGITGKNAHTSQQTNLFPS